MGTAYSQTVAATGGTGARTYSISAGALPAGLMINASTGAISSTPTGPAGTASFTVMVVDSGTPQQTDTQALTLDINDPLVIITMVLPNATIGVAYNAPVSTTGGSGTLAFTISSGALPAGLVINAGNGTISGTPTAGATTQTFTMRVADGSSPQQVDTQGFTIVMTLEITTVSLPNATAGTLYSQTLQARGGLPPYSWSRIAGSMPPGIADPVAASGVISGTPNSVCMATASNFTAQVMDSAAAPASDNQPLSVTVIPGPAVNVASPSPLPTGVQNSPYSVFIQATGGVPPYMFALSFGNLPAGLMGPDTNTGEIDGTPTMAETSVFSVTVTDSCADNHTQGYSITTNAVAPGRNDTVATATPLATGGNLTFAASISPVNDPNSDPLEPDQDFYEITAAAGATVTITVLGPGLNPSSYLDPVIEIQDMSGARLITCRDPGDNAPPAPVDVDTTPIAFDDPCINDDIDLGVTRDSMLEFQNMTGGVLTFFVRVFDFRGDARPDLLYQITITGAN